MPKNRRSPSWLIWVLVPLALVLAPQAQADGKAKSLSKLGKTMLENKFFAKGGLGIVNPELYIVTTTSKNALHFGNGDEWVGQERNLKEVVVFWQGRVYGISSVPAGFELKNCIVVSFEEQKVYFSDFQHGVSGYYERQALDK